eukprot:CAMPEP_0114290688 /NCGR_PEP_ID=MMETSP0059-20121206/8076_1 /TAXON_ID=36894 /ORGANISM="Pyramimonas parkeae, Strain CCMP726" /LENGTH=181 /DNA_ID=CAMNT_0001412115 /DNA_START=74 /DNA_END=619 /DNA_ORIENTATION=+
MAMLRSLSNTPRVGGVLDDFFDNGFGMMPWGAFPVAPFLGDRGDELSRSQQNQRQKLGVINMDVAELSDHFEVHASLPGVKKDQVKLDVDGDILRVSCETKEERLDQSPEGLSEDQQQAQQEPGVTWHRIERFKSFASRTLRMPETADLSQVSAKMEDGILTVNVAKKAEFAAKQRRVAIA